MCIRDRLWTPKEKRDEADFIKRLEGEFPRLDAMKVNASKSLYQVRFKLIQGRTLGSITVKTPYDGGGGVKVWQDPESMLKSDANGLNIQSDAVLKAHGYDFLLYTSPSPRDRTSSRIPSSAWKKLEQICR